MIKPAYIKKNIKDIYLEFSRFLLRHYPRFVTSSLTQSSGDYIPVFCFHSVTHNNFKEKLIYLKENGYNSLHAAEFLSILEEGSSAPEKLVVLTFDDGHISLWSVAFPLLKEYGFKATAFIIPGYIKGSHQIHHIPNKDDNLFKPIPYSMINWQQAQEMQDSGVVDIQSHTLYHQSHFIGEGIVDFFSAAERHTSQWLELPVWRWKGEDKEGHIPPPGLPLYKTAARMSGKPRYFEDEELSYRCVEYVRQSDGVNYFKLKGRKRGLAFVVNDYKKKKSSKGRFELPEETIHAVRNDLLRSKVLIEEHIPGHRVTFLAYPWGIGSQLAVEQSKKIGFKGNFWTIGPKKQANCIGGSPFFINRIKDDYIFRLPGKGRKSLWEIFKMKLARRMSGEDIY
jgi:hypothetical protein